LLHTSQWVRENLAEFSACTDVTTCHNLGEKKIYSWKKMDDGVPWGGKRVAGKKEEGVREVNG